MSVKNENLDGPRPSSPQSPKPVLEEAQHKGRTWQQICFPIACKVWDEENTFYKGLAIITGLFGGIINAATLGLKPLITHLIYSHYERNVEVFQPQNSETLSVENPEEDKKDVLSELLEEENQTTETPKQKEHDFMSFEADDLLLSYDVIPSSSQVEPKDLLTFEPEEIDRILALKKLIPPLYTQETCLPQSTSLPQPKVNPTKTTVQKDEETKEKQAPFYWLDPCNEDSSLRDFFSHGIQKQRALLEPPRPLIDPELLKKALALEDSFEDDGTPLLGYHPLSQAIVHPSPTKSSVPPNSPFNALTRTSTPMPNQPLVSLLSSPFHRDPSMSSVLPNTTFDAPRSTPTLMPSSAKNKEDRISPDEQIKKIDARITEIDAQTKEIKTNRELFSRMAEMMGLPTPCQGDALLKQLRDLNEASELFLGEISSIVNLLKLPFDLRHLINCLNQMSDEKKVPEELIDLCNWFYGKDEKITDLSKGPVLGTDTAIPQTLKKQREMIREMLKILGLHENCSKELFWKRFVDQFKTTYTFFLTFQAALDILGEPTEKMDFQTRRKIAERTPKTVDRSKQKEIRQDAELLSLRERNQISIIDTLRRANDEIDHQMLSAHIENLPETVMQQRLELLNTRIRESGNRAAIDRLERRQTTNTIQKVFLFACTIFMPPIITGLKAYIEKKNRIYPV